MRYRSLPAECEAEQFIDRGRQVPQVPKGLQSDNDGLFVVTAHGQRTAVVDRDYIVAEPDGRGFYPVKPDIFEKRWEALPFDVAHRCCVCQSNWVDSDNGEDTCASCKGRV